MEAIWWLALFCHVRFCSAVHAGCRRVTARSRSHGLPDPRPDGPGRLPPEALQPAPPRRVRLPPVWRPRGPQRPPPSPRLPGRRLPLQGMPTGVQYVHGNTLARDSLSPAQILLILRGIAPGVPTAKLAREVGIGRQHLLRLRHEIQARALAAVDHSTLPDDRTEADEKYQNAGK